MSWKDSLRKASFKGAEFWWLDLNTTLDPMVVVHKYPQRRGGWAEDLGLGPDEFEITGFVLGADYMAARDKLIKALKEGGAGTLVHPTLGEKKVVLSQKPRITETTREGGMARFSMVFTEEGENKYPEDKALASAGVAPAATAAKEAVAADFVRSFDTQGLDLLKLDAVGALGEALDAIAAELAPAREALSFGMSVANHLSAQVSALMRLAADPLAAVLNALGLSGSLFSFFGGLSGFGSGRSSSRSSTSNTLSGLSALSSYGSTTTATTSAAQDTNRAALVTLVRRAAAISAAEVAATASYDSRDDALAARDTAAQALDRVRIDDGATGTVFATLTDLRAATVGGVAEQAGTLASVRRIETGESMSATQLAYRELGDSSRAAEIVARNRAQVWNPLFVPAGSTIEVVDG